MSDANVAKIKDIKTAREKQQLLRALTIGNYIAPCSEKKIGRKRVSMAVRSGACESVIDAEEDAPDYRIFETKASRSG